MDVEEVGRVVGDTPNMTQEQAHRLTEFMTRERVLDVLELGFNHGVSTSYMAAHLTGRGGHITTIDFVSARHREPNIEGLLGKFGLRNLVTIHYEPTSYTWRLMKLLEEDDSPRFDLCYIDGAHSWFVDGFAFFLVDRLLRPGGWIVFDDLDWTFESMSDKT